MKMGHFVRFIVFASPGDRANYLELKFLSVVAECD